MIGIVGAGFVGSAVKNAYDTYNIPTIVRDPVKGFNASWEDICDCTAVFVCVPSPSAENGEADTSILEEVLDNIKSIKGVIISKVTAPPTVYKNLQAKYPNLVHAPEFLVALNANEDYINSTFSFIGGSRTYAQLAKEFIKLGQIHLKSIKYCSIEEASLAKYTINSFLALKVSFMNQIYNLSKEVGADYNVLKELLMDDERLGTSHFDVPGPDGKRGFGGACFPKDVKAITAVSKSLGVELKLLTDILQYNEKLR
tara:strand:- start:129 stop:896 length:768 start_codon:yes stop_codon:yes gene_type:complete